MSVDLELPSDDWGKYKCVFQLSGVKDEIITKLDKTVIRTNWGKTEIRGAEWECLSVSFSFVFSPSI